MSCYGYYKDHRFVFRVWYKNGASKEVRVVAKFDHMAWKQMSEVHDFANVQSIVLETVEKL